MTSRTAITAAIILSLAAAGAPSASARPVGYTPTGHVSASNQPPASVYDRADREMIPLTAPSGGDVAQATPPRAVIRAQAPKSGFDWGDAGIGGGLALTLIGVGGAVAASQRRNRRTTALPS
jgi:hypothetical protein